MINSHAKGGAGEREFCKWLKDNIGLEAQRKLGQARDEGADVLIGPFVFEVKRCERLDLRTWWLQVCTSEDGIRVVAFRQNKQPWRFLISATYIGLTNGFIQLEERIALLWFKQQYSFWLNRYPV